MNWVIMPYVDNHGYTEVAALDVIRQTLPDVHLLLINNGGAPVPFNDPVVHHWRHDPPLPSLAATWNRALQFVWDSGGEHALVVNNDVRLPPKTYELLLEVQRLSGGWFVTACNIGQEEWDRGVIKQELPDPASKGGPDFSCFLITQECHRWFQFDEHFIPAYHEDNDYHRRLQLAGLGDRIFSVCVPYLHYGSATINRSPEIAAAFARKFEQCRAYYVKKWGGVPGEETFPYPFAGKLHTVNDTAAAILAGRPPNHLYTLTGQGVPDATMEGPYPWASPSIS